MLLSCFQIFSCSKNNGGRRSSEAADKRKDPNDSVSHKAWASHAKTQHEVIGERAAMIAAVPRGGGKRGGAAPAAAAGALLFPSPGKF